MALGIGGPEFIPSYRKYKEYLTNDINWHKSFGNGPEMIDKLHAMNLKIALHLNSRNFKRYISKSYSCWTSA